MNFTLLCRMGCVLPLILMPGAGVRAQYYYKDIVTVAQSQDKWKTLRDNRVRRVTLQSLERDGQPTPGFVCTQTASSDYKRLTTYTTSSGIPPSTLTAFYDQTGKLMKTTDSSESYVSTTVYEYAQTGLLAAVRNTAPETDNQLRSTEDHLWIYGAGVATSMKKIKNGKDTTYVIFKVENGNVTEEQATHGTEKMPAVYYYYDSAGLLTDIVKYNTRAQRLLPVNMFSYQKGRPISMISVPPSGGDYENWSYEYGDKNLRVRDVCRNKRKETIAIIIYSYNFQ